MTRRELMRLVAGLAMPAADQVEPLRRNGASQRVLVIGSGLAGLCSAFELQNQGHEVVVLEAQMHPGGRVHTVRAPFAPGVYSEAGASQIPRNHDLTLHYARTLGLKLAPALPPGKHTMYMVKGRRIVMDGVSKPDWPFALTAAERELGADGLRKKYIGAAMEEAQAAGFSRDPVAALSAWDKQTLGAWLQARGASPGAIELLTLGFGTDFSSAAYYLMYSLNLVGAGPSQRIEGGNDLLPYEFAKKVTVRYGAPVASVSQDDRGARVTIRRVGETETLKADRVICAIPCPVIGGILDPARISGAKQQAIRRQRYSHSMKIFLQTRSRFWLNEGLSGSVNSDLPIERLIPGAGEVAGDRGVIAAFPIGPYCGRLEAMTENERVKAAFSQARQLLPELAQQFEGGMSKCWGLDPWQRGAFVVHGPGELSQITTLAKREGRIHFAGEHTSRWNGWMQGALESARRVVGEINEAGS